MGYHTGTCEGEGFVDFVIDELPLMTGSYEIYTGVRPVLMHAPSTTSIRCEWRSVPEAT
ncbi:MAG: hypothetical protein R2735_14580 [Microthrixaceae bacterium]